MVGINNRRNVVTGPNSSTVLVLLKGERHSGTNFMRAVLTRFLAVQPLPKPLVDTFMARSAPARHLQPPRIEDEPQREPLMCCWKHGYASEACLPRPPAGPAPTALFVVLVRTPYSWLPNLWLTPYDTGTQASSESGNVWPLHYLALLVHACQPVISPIVGPR